MATTKKDNDFLADKIELRLDAIKDLKKVRVLDCFGGYGIIWERISFLSPGKIERLAIDVRSDEIGFHLHGDNSAMLDSLDLARFNVIDLDAYGVPFAQIKKIFDKKFKGIVVCTFIQTSQGTIPHALLVDVGFSKIMINKAPTLCYRGGFDLMLQWLGNHGIEKIYRRSHLRKNYFYFVIQ